MVSRLCALAIGVCAIGCSPTSDASPGVVAACNGARSCNSQDCYASCYCDSGKTATCEQRCGARGVRVQDLDESVWMDAWVGREDEVLERVNAARAAGGCCGAEGCFPASAPLELDASLRSSARAHALEMAIENYFAHDSKDGRTPFDRMREARFSGCAMGENIAAGQMTPAEVVDDWLHSPGHCANILAPAFDRIGVGYHDADNDLRTVWVQNFGAL